MNEYIVQIGTYSKENISCVPDKEHEYIIKADSMDEAIKKAPKPLGMYMILDAYNYRINA